MTIVQALKNLVTAFGGTRNAKTASQAIEDVTDAVDGLGYDLVIHVVDYDHATLLKGNYDDLYEKANNREVINGVLLWDRDDEENIVKLTDKFIAVSSYLMTNVVTSPVYFTFFWGTDATTWYVASDNSVGTTD